MTESSTFLLFDEFFVFFSFVAEAFSPENRDLRSLTDY